MAGVGVVVVVVVSVVVLVVRRHPLLTKVCRRWNSRSHLHFDRQGLDNTLIRQYLDNTLYCNIGTDAQTTPNPVQPCRPDRLPEVQTQTFSTSSKPSIFRCFMCKRFPWMQNRCSRFREAMILNTAIFHCKFV